MNMQGSSSSIEEKTDFLGASKPSVLAIIPCLNEAAHIEEVALKLLEDAGSLALTVVIADGGSCDGTLEIAQKLAAKHSEIIVLKNERRIQSAALNRATEKYSAGKDYLIRVDAHCSYPDNYCWRLVEIQRKTCAASVVVSMTAKGTSCFQRAAAAAQNSPLGNGGSPHRNSGDGRFVDHGHHALMLLPAFRRVGGYDETFSHNEDAELDMRLRAARFQIWLTGEFCVTYFPRASTRALLRQYFNYGRGRFRTLIKHREWPRVRQTLPLGVAPAAAAALLSPFAPVLAIPALAWASLCIFYGAILGIRRGDSCVAMSGLAAMTMHMGWSLGFLSAGAHFFASKTSSRVLGARGSQKSPARSV